MKTQVRLNLYEREIANVLGGYDSCQAHAERLVRAQEIGYSPDTWLQRIRTIELEELKDPRISEHEHSTEICPIIS